MSDKYLTLVFKISDHEKFREFHKEYFCCDMAEATKLEGKIGARAVVSAWGNLHSEKNRLEALYEIAYDKSCDYIQDILHIMEIEGCPYEEALKIFRDGEK